MSLLHTERMGGVWRVRLQDSARRNALSAEMKTALLDAVQTWAHDPDLRCLLLCADGPAFCAGGDLSTLGQDRSPVAARARIASSHQLLRLLTETEKPVVCAIQGAAVGAGFSLALAGDITLASEGAWFASAFAQVGALPDLGALHTLPRLVGMARAKDLLMTGRRVSAQEAAAMGMVSRLLPEADFDAAALSVAQQLAAGPGVSLGLSKTLMHSGLSAFLAQESLGQATAFASADFAEGLAAFAEKRPAEFKGR